jgi:hypothetical protein
MFTYFSEVVSQSSKHFDDLERIIMRPVSDNQLRSAVLLLIFKRLDTTKEVFASIRNVQPLKLYIASDGPSPHVRGECDKVQAVREYVISNVDWNCEVHTLFRVENLGCKYAVSEAIKWFLEYEEMGIILEDDCLPTHSFFMFCDELLEKYKDNDKVAMISGRNDLDDRYVNRQEPYFFSTRGLIWGWATWRRAFHDFDVELGTDRKPVNSFSLVTASSSIVEFLYRRRNIQKIKSQEVNSWAYPWGIYILLKRQYAIIPTRNMVRNIGFSPDATHTILSSIDNVKVHEISFPCFSEQRIIPDPIFSKASIISEHGGFLHFLMSSFSILRYFRRVLRTIKLEFLSSRLS